MKNKIHGKERKKNKKRKQHDQVVVSKFPNIESAIALMTGLAMDLCSNKLKLEDGRKKRARNRMIKKGTQLPWVRMNNLA